MNFNLVMKEEMREHMLMMEELEKNDLPAVETAGKHLYECLSNGNKILVAGNGGSAADSQHFTAELIGRFSTNRRALAALALTTDTSAITAISNDFTYDHVFSRQVEGLGQKGDAFIAISTSGNSMNLVKALEMAHKKGMHTIALLGKTGGKMAGLASESIIVPSSTTQRIQEAHEWILHTWCAYLDWSVSEEDS